MLVGQSGAAVRCVNGPQIFNIWRIKNYSNGATVIGGGGVGSCRYFLNNERWVLADTAAGHVNTLFIWDRWSNTAHVIGEYALKVSFRDQAVLVILCEGQAANRNPSVTLGLV